MSPHAGRRGWRNIGSEAAFWVLAALGAPVMTLAWFALPLASLEEGTEQPKALAAGTSMAGMTFWFGWLPVIAAHVIGLLILCGVCWSGRTNRRSGLWIGGTAVVAASAIGLLITLVLSGGELFYSPTYVP